MQANSCKSKKHRTSGLSMACTHNFTMSLLPRWRANDGDSKTTRSAISDRRAMQQKNEAKAASVPHPGRYQAATHL